MVRRSEGNMKTFLSPERMQRFWTNEGTKSVWQWANPASHECVICTNNFNQAQSMYKHSLTFCIWRYVVIATKPAQRLQIRPRLHPHHSPNLHLGLCISVGMRRGTDTRTQMAVTNINFASAMFHTKCNERLKNTGEKCSSYVSCAVMRPGFM